MSKPMEYRQPMRTWATNDDDSPMRNYARGEGSGTVQDILDYLSREAPGVPLSKVSTGAPLLIWESPPTEVEIEHRLLSRAKSDARHEEWERKMFKELLAKYGAPQVAEEAHTMADAVCEGFQWIGQSFAFCDGCGFPYWEHTHENRLDGGPVYGTWKQVLITPEQAESCRRKWGTS